MMYSPDSIGLGHVKRNTSIAKAVVAEASDINVILVVGSGAGAFFDLPKGVDVIKLPSVDKVAAETWQPRSLSLPTEKTKQLRANLLRQAVETVDPDVLLVDHLPQGVWSELLPLLEAIKRKKGSTKLILGLRDILDDAEVIRRKWHREKTYEAIAEYYDKVLIYGHREIVPTADLYGLTEQFPQKIEYCGYINGATDVLRKRISRVAAADLPGLNSIRDDQRVIFVQAGGGFDAYPMISASLAALRRLDDDDSMRAIVVAGPLMPDGDRVCLLEEANGLKNTTVLPWTSSCDSYFRVADVGIIMGGYNSFLEGLQSRAQLISIPRAGPSAEQSMRADLMEKRGLASCVSLDQATPERLVREIAQALRKPRSARRRIDLDGNRRAASILISELGRADVAPLVMNSQRAEYHHEFL